MLGGRVARPLCKSCRSSLLSTFVNGFVAPQRQSLRRGVTPLNRRRPPVTRALHSTTIRRDGISQVPQEDVSPDVSRSPQDEREIEDFLKRVIQYYDESILPANLLTQEELRIYDRFYGEPELATHEDIKQDPEFGAPLRNLKQDAVESGDTWLVQRIEKNYPYLDELAYTDWDDPNPVELVDDDVEGRSSNMLLRPSADGSLEEVEYDTIPANAHVIDDELRYEEKPNPISRHVREKMDEIEEQGKLGPEGQEIDVAEEDRFEAEQSSDILIDKDADRLEAEEYMAQLDEEAGEQSQDPRTHPYTAEGRFATSPSTMQLPKETFVDPITARLSDVSKKHLSEFAHKIFGGSRIPDSVATPSTRGHLQQKPIALEAGQGKMRAMEANAYIATMLPGLYASISSTLVETRRRLGSEWLEGLLRRPKGFRVLDAGGGGAGALAFRDMLRAEWDRMHPEGTIEPTPLGKATVVTGSYELRSSVSGLLEDTSFIPRLPDFSAARDVPGAREFNPSARKQYDVIIAPHTLWTFEEDYMRKHQVQNYWYLLNPQGGVLVILEKGVPRGFELVAGAREALLENHISSPGAEQHPDEKLTELSGSSRTKEPGMIIAPCTNHGTCPMYTTPGATAGRQDTCHFQQRFTRPAFLQRVLGESHQNYEDIRFSYIAVRRGKDARIERNITQNEKATLTALNGYEQSDKMPEPLTLPRIVLPPIKRHKHVTFDMCTPSAQLERWTIPVSKSKQGYRDARKARWGDLWALGAKTRVVRDARSGVLKEGKFAKKRIIQVADDGMREVKESSLVRKRKDGRKGRTWQKGRVITEADLV